MTFLIYFATWQHKLANVGVFFSADEIRNFDSITSEYVFCN